MDNQELPIANGSVSAAREFAHDIAYKALGFTKEHLAPSNALRMGKTSLQLTMSRKYGKLSP